MKKTMRSLQKGRSMLEVIAVIAVMGILLIAGMIGFKILLDYLKHKETVEQIATIGMRYKAERLKGTSVETKYVPSKQFYPEGNNCENGTKTDCVTTPEGGNVHLFSIADSRNFVVFTNFNNARTCEEVALMGGYEYAFGLKEKLPEGNAIQKGHDEFFLNKDQGRDPEQTFTHYPTKEQNASQIINSAGESFSFSADYLKKNPNALKVFCDTNIPLGFVYTAGDCKYMCGGVCQSCPCNQVEDNEGTCCIDDDIKCGTCNGCKDGKKCLTDDEDDPFSGRCVQCIENSDCNQDNNEFCQNNRCVECTEPYYELKDDPDSGEKFCECKALGREINQECDASCNCAQGLFCYEDPTTSTKTCKECLIQPDCPGNVPCDNGQCRCDDDEHPCPPGQICCNETCCPAGQFCNDGVCSNCETNDQCGENRICCNGVCCAEEAASCCNGQCCNNDCTEVDGQKICGGCDENEDCPDNEYCDTTEHVCKPCLNEALDICEDSVTENFNTKCYTKKHLNCLDSTDTKDVPALITSAPNVKTPICANGANETDATCKPCTSTEECQKLEGKGDRNRTLLKNDKETKVGNVLFEDFVCRTQGVNEGSCGPCEVNADCEDNVPCLESGKCGCERDSDCSFKCDGKTTCNTGDKDCACTSPLQPNNEGNCVCPTNSDKIWRLNNNNGNAQYACCPEGQLPSNGECYPECTNQPAKINNVKIFVDHSYSTVVGSTKIAEDIEKARKLIRRLINNVGRTISVSESNEYTESDALTVTRTIGGESITFTAFNCGDNGHTCFANPNEDNGAIPAPREGTLTFILSDGVLPEATTKNLDSVYTIVFAKKGTRLHGIEEEHIIPFEKLNSNQLEERISYVISTSICMSIEDISDQLHTGCNSDENP